MLIQQTVSFLSVYSNLIACALGDLRLGQFIASTLARFCTRNDPALEKGGTKSSNVYSSASSSVNSM